MDKDYPYHTNAKIFETLKLPSSLCVRDAIHTHFVTLIGKWTIVGGWVKNRADKRGKVAKSKYKSSVSSL